MDTKTARGHLYGRVLIALVLASALVAALGIAAVPAAAQTGCDCHTAVPPTNGAPAAHAPYVVSVTDCTTCHVGMTVPHAGPITAPISYMNGMSIDAGYKLYGEIYDAPMLGVGVPHPGVTVYLQQRALGETTFTDVGQATTNTNGRFAFTVTSPVPYAYYRDVVQGWIGPTWTSLPSIDNLKPTPTLTLRLIGPTGGVLPLGHSLTAKVKAKPAQMAGETVKFRLQKRAAAKWITRLSVKRTLSASASCSWTYKARARGLYRIRAGNIGSADFAKHGSGWRQYRVK